MLVDVVCMRRGGDKLSKAEIAEAISIRGELSMSTAEWADPYKQTMPKELTTFASLGDPDNRGAVPLLPFLIRANVNRIVGDSFVVVGLEPHPARPGDYQVQAWWCRRVDLPHTN